MPSESLLPPQVFWRKLFGCITGIFWFGILCMADTFPVRLTSGSIPEPLQPWRELFFAEFRTRPDIREADGDANYYYRAFFEYTHHNDTVTVGVRPPYDPEVFSSRSWKADDITAAELGEAARTLAIPRCYRDYPLPAPADTPQELPPGAARAAQQAAALWDANRPLTAAAIAAAVPLLEQAFAPGLADPGVEWCMYRLRTLPRGEFQTLPPEAQEQLRSLLRGYVDARTRELAYLAQTGDASWEDKSGRLRRAAARAQRFRALWRSVQCEWDYRTAALLETEQQTLTAELEAALPALMEYYRSRSRSYSDRGKWEMVFDDARIDFSGFFLFAPPGDYAGLDAAEKEALRRNLEWLAASPFYPTACAGIEGLYRLETADGVADAPQLLFDRWSRALRRCPDFPMYAAYQPPLRDIGREVFTAGQLLRLQDDSIRHYRNYTLFLEELETAVFPPGELEWARNLLSQCSPDDPELLRRYQQLSERLKLEQIP